jgi:hypothetical protein
MRRIGTVGDDELVDVEPASNRSPAAVDNNPQK